MKSIILLGYILFFNSFLNLEHQAINTSYRYIIDSSFENHEYTTNEDVNDESDNILSKSSPNSNEDTINIIELPTLESSSIESITLDEIISR